MRARFRRAFCTAAAALVAAVAAMAVVNSEVEALVEDSHWKRARAALEPLARNNPNDPRTLYLLAQVRNAFRDYKGALALAEKAAALDPRNAQYRGAVADSACDLADVEKSFTWARRCKKEMQATVDLNPQEIGARRGLMEFNMQAPWIVGGSKSDARKILEDIKRLNAAQGFLAQVRMNQLEEKKEPPEPLLLQAYQADPSSYQVLMALAGFYLNSNPRKYEQAERYAREALKQKPGRTGPYASLAASATLQQKWADADAILAQAEKAIPDNFAPHFSAGRALAQNGADLQRAERHMKKYLSIEPEPGTATHADAHYWLGIIYEKMGRKPDAIRELEESLRLNPKNEQAQKDLKRLKG